MNVNVKITTRLRKTVGSSRVSSLITALPAAMPFSSLAGFRFATAHSAFPALFTSLVPLPPPSNPGQRLYKELTGKSKFRAINHLISKACACLLASGFPIFLEELKAAELAAYPFTKAEYDGGTTYGARQNSGGVTIAARTILLTDDLKNNTGAYQIDLISTLTQTIGTINANNVTSASIYGASSPAQFLAGNFNQITTINLSNGFVNSAGGAIQTVNTANGPQFAQASDLGSSSASTGSATYFGFSGLTSLAQSQDLANFFNNYSTGSNLAIGISFSMNSDDGRMKIGSTNSGQGLLNRDTTNNVLAFGFQHPSRSLGFVLTPAIPEPTTAPSVLIHLTPTHSNLTLRHLSPGVLYRVKTSSNLVAWGEAHSLAGPTNGEDVEWSELLVPTGPRFYRLEWDE